MTCDLCFVPAVASSSFADLFQTKGLFVARNNMSQAAENSNFSSTKYYFLSSNDRSEPFLHLAAPEFLLTLNARSSLCSAQPRPQGLLLDDVQNGGSSGEDPGKG